MCRQAYAADIRKSVLLHNDFIDVIVSQIVLLLFRVTSTSTTMPTTTTTTSETSTLALHETEAEKDNDLEEPRKSVLSVFSDSIFARLLRG